MAKIITGPIIADIRGKTGEIVFNRNRGGNYARALKLTAAGAGAADGARVWRNEAVVLPGESSTMLDYTTERWDVGNMADLEAQPTQLTAQHAGVYLVNTTLAFSATAPASVTAFFLINGETLFAKEDRDIDDTRLWGLTMTTLVKVEIGDFMEVMINILTTDSVTVMPTDDMGTDFGAQQLTSV